MVAVSSLLDALLDFTKPLPAGAAEWKSIDNLKQAVDAK
jgi:hypothetical protein